MSFKSHDDSCELCGVVREADLRSVGRGGEMLADIREDGFHKVGVFSEISGESEYSYTIGMFHTFQHAEVVVFGLEIETEFAILDTICGLVQAGSVFQEGDISPEVLEGVEVVFRDLGEAGCNEYLTQAKNFYKSDSYPVLIMAWPDGSGVFPWDDVAPGWLKERQPAVWNTHNGNR
ncbi:DUF4262 domain-containing protein [Amycolatopsis samaneae]|uniref:DUF4262 domain-containing protein n=1 Tax=Amycolatopsis samaneae TaxID=664691 RepID=A0ABW5GA61_9PSEU